MFNHDHHSSPSEDPSTPRESIQLGIFPVEGNLHAACIIMDLPSKGKSLFMAVLPPRGEISQGVRYLQDKKNAKYSLFGESPFQVWGRDYPSIASTPLGRLLRRLADEDRKDINMLTLPSGVTVHEYAVRILIPQTTYPVAEGERDRDLISHSNRVLSTALENAGGETARSDIRKFLKKLRTESPEKTILGLGEPFSIPPRHARKIAPPSKSRQRI